MKLMELISTYGTHITEHFRWDEILQNNLNANGYEGYDFNYIDDPNIIYEVRFGCEMLEEYRDELGHQISGQSGHRPELYNDVVLPENKYASSRTSDHKYKRSFAFDSDVPATNVNIQKWKDICNKRRVHWSIGLYSWGLHLGYRRHTGTRLWDNR